MKTIASKINKKWNDSITENSEGTARPSAAAKHIQIIHRKLGRQVQVRTGQLAFRGQCIHRKCLSAGTLIGRKLLVSWLARVFEVWLLHGVA